jgi:hypothetical protein
MMVTNRAGSGDAKYDAYAQTILEVHGAARARVDLRRPIGPAERAALASVGLDREFAVLTAENPHGRNEEDAATSAEADRRDAENDDRLAALVARLGEAGVPFVRVDGVAPDGGYRERCVAVLLPRPEAATLALRLGQLALFWFDGETFWLIPAEADAPPRRLPAP